MLWYEAEGLEWERCGLKELRDIVYSVSEFWEYGRRGWQCVKGAGGCSHQPAVLLLTTGPQWYRDYMGLILGLYRDNGKENGNYYIAPSL